MELFKDRSASIENTQQIKVAETLQQLISYLEDLTDIVNKVKLKNEAEFINAYHNHMKKINAELKELRSKTEEQQNQNQNRTRVSNGENELGYFREECLRLYQKVEIKNRENYELKFKIQELQQSNDFLEQQIKSLMRRVKTLEINQDQEQPINPMMDQTFCTTPAQTKTHRKVINEYHSKIDANSIFSKQYYSIVKDILDSDDKVISTNDIIEKLSKYIASIEIKYQRQNQFLNTKVQKLLISQNKKSIIRSDLEEFFLECVESVRKDILKRRPNGNAQQLQKITDQILDFSQFYKEDKQKVLELVISNEKILVFLYQKIFPNHINLVLQSIKEDKSINNFLEESLTLPKRDIRSLSLNKQLEVRKGKLSFRQY